MAENQTEMITQLRPFIGRKRELDRALSLLRTPERHSRSLLFLGAPKTGKSSLLDEIAQSVEKELEDEQRDRLIWVKIPCSEQGICMDGSPISWQTLLSLISDAARKRNSSLHNGLSELISSAMGMESSSEWPKFFSQLIEHNQGRELYVFALDDFDRAWAVERSHEQALNAQDFIHFAVAPNVRLIATARYQIMALPAEPIWLRFLGEKAARELAESLLTPRGQLSEKVLAKVLEQAGRHPFQIRTLCRRLGTEEITRDVSSHTLGNWQSSDVITQYLKEVKSYLEAQVKARVSDIEIWDTLAKISKGESCAGYETEVSCLVDWAVVAKDDQEEPKISSVLLQQAVGDWLSIRVKESARQLDGSKRFLGWLGGPSALFWLTYGTALLILFSTGLLRVLKVDENLALLWMLPSVILFIIGRIFGLESEEKNERR